MFWKLIIPLCVVCRVGKIGIQQKLAFMHTVMNIEFNIVVEF